jgi:hypothetical protein
MFQSKKPQNNVQKQSKHNRQKTRPKEGVRVLADANGGEDGGAKDKTWTSAGTGAAMSNTWSSPTSTATTVSVCAASKEQNGERKKKT